MTEQIPEVAEAPKRKYTRRQIQSAQPAQPFVPKEKHPAWVTAKEEDKAEKMIGKRFVRLDLETKSPVKESKDFFYTITDIHNYMPAVKNQDLMAPIANTEQHLIKVHVQKYYRHEYNTVKVAMDGGNTRETKVNRPVAKWAQIGKLGDYKMVIGNEDGNFHMDLREFLSQFVPDQNE